MPDVQLNPYPLDDGMEELARLKVQEDFFNEHTRFPTGKAQMLPVSLAPGSIVVDVGCGTGGWGCKVAQEHPDLQVIGIDLSQKRIEYARACATTQKLTNTRFLIGDFQELQKILQGQQAQYLHARLIQWFTPNFLELVRRWIADCLAAGGTICLVDAETHITNSLAFNTVFRHMSRRHSEKTPNLVGQGISDSWGGTLTLRSALLAAGCHNIVEQAFWINFSAGIPGRNGYIYDLSHSVEYIANLLRADFSPEDLQTLIQQYLYDLKQSPAFLGVQTLVAAYGTKPA